MKLEMNRVWAKQEEQMYYKPARAWIHRFGLESFMYGEERLHGHISGISYSYTVNMSIPININNGESDE